ncbi:tRNA (adenosine(37)-N6)-dimethylallyltransferase MiaA [Phormidesmis priestleyi ULC007]|uniref:tRNA dimethylallyltransferase n=1 Tax=Phormidesmis priestleyi ULC007 TaxID=1920490 RepID=A0A2T1DC74_9CYAN|nr:tRNA (adenosine(37)-N6)-dimethylallyltransferase MiaA [Phormidesmis priestleyi]PSB18132.1 tRNA (adenosine(37)-N6)-dimethylallyltransferase MiaA [Phormidesmis priestleyi ULC007]PZO49598.1 MAG: tRNA (adenosine(37)-N6)-dimethylallyltransferase MiaA [Phormidesmis priestleyi]
MDQPILPQEPNFEPIFLSNNTPVPFLIVVCGATATGKSSLAISLALWLNASILSADSRQVYREFNIGTAKPTLSEQKLVPHALIDICEPIETLTLAQYQGLAQALIQTPGPKLLVGGTGLHIKSIVRGLKIPKVAPQMGLRSQLQTLGQPQLYAFLQQVDPPSAHRIHAHDQVRTLRALEVYYVTGRPITEQQGEYPPSYPILQIGLDCESVEVGDRRIEQRTRQMLEVGFATEVKTLCEKYGEIPLLETLGYAEMKQYLNGDISLLEAEKLIVLHTRQFAKRQRTWFRADSSIEWFDADRPDLLEQVWNRVRDFLDNNKVEQINAIL